MKTHKYAFDRQYRHGGLEWVPTVCGSGSPRAAYGGVWPSDEETVNCKRCLKKPKKKRKLP
jgi:hypothetical protein